MSALRCRFCKCTEESPRTKPDGDDCVVNYSTGVCDMPDCQRSLAAENTRALYERKKRRPRRLTSAEVHKDICRRRHGSNAPEGQRKLPSAKPPKGGSAA